MLRLFALVAATGCSFEAGRFTGRGDGGPSLDDDASIIDAPPDAHVAQLCDPTPGLHVCFSFDEGVTSPLANEGSAAGVEMQLTSAAPIAVAQGQAVAVTPASKLYIPPAASLTGIRTLEMWARIDADPASIGGRIGLLDADVTTSSMSFFYYRQGMLGFQLRYEITVQMFLDKVIAPGTWVYLAQVCDTNNVLTAYLNGQILAATAGCNPGDATPHGIIVGANNNQNGNKDSELTGAIDGLRLWTSARTPEQIAEAYGSFASQ